MTGYDSTNDVLLDDDTFTSPAALLRNRSVLGYSESLDDRDVKYCPV